MPIRLNAREKGNDLDDLPTAAYWGKVDLYTVESDSKRGTFRRVLKLADGNYNCDCPAQVECRHIKLAKQMNGIRLVAS